MGEVQRRGGAPRGPQGRNQNERTYVYVDGTAVRKLQEAPESRERRRAPSARPAAKESREYALSMNLGYVLFLAIAAAVCMFTCVNFLQLQVKETRLQKQVTSLETKLNAAILENDSKYDQVIASVDMERVKDVAVNELGMVYAKKSQIVTYELENNDYVRQYTEVPRE